MRSYCDQWWSSGQKVLASWYRAQLHSVKTIEAASLGCKQAFGKTVSPVGRSDVEPFLSALWTDRRISSTIPTKGRGSSTQVCRSNSEASIYNIGGVVPIVLMFRRSIGQAASDRRRSLARAESEYRFRLGLVSRPVVGGALSCSCDRSDFPVDRPRNTRWVGLPLRLRLPGSSLFLAQDLPRVRNHGGGNK